MSDYMTYERLEQIAKVVGTECKERSDWYNYKEQINGYSASQDFTNRDFLLSDGSLKTLTLCTELMGWMKDETLDRYIYYIDLEYNGYNWVAYKKGYVYITDAEIKKRSCYFAGQRAQTHLCGDKESQWSMGEARPTACKAIWCVREAKRNDKKDVANAKAWWPPTALFLCLERRTQ